MADCSMPRSPLSAQETEVEVGRVSESPSWGVRELASRACQRMLGESGVIVGVSAGTTRDAIDTQVRWHGKDILLIDTAGIRQRGRIEPGVEKYSVLRALKALERSNVVLLLIDAAAGLTAQDAHVAGYAVDANKSIVIVANKWDLVQKDSTTLETYREYLRRQLNFVPYAPIVFTPLSPTSASSRCSKQPFACTSNGTSASLRAN